MNKEICIINKVTRNKGEPIQFYRFRSDVRSCKTIGLPLIIREFKSKEQAAAFVDGASWMAQNLGLKVEGRMRMMDKEETKNL